MSYTAPTYADTREQAILALASTIADEDKSALGDGSVNRALDVLADVLAGEDIEVPQTDAGAILALAGYVKGGGSPALGNPAMVAVINDPGGTTAFTAMAYVGDALVAGSPQTPIFMAAHGMRVELEAQCAPDAAITAEAGTVAGSEPFTDFTTEFSGGSVKIAFDVPDLPGPVMETQAGVFFYIAAE